jgi:hypothetical protein
MKAALDGVSKLLPKNYGADREGEEWNRKGSKKKSTSFSTGKAGTVEMAICYIRCLKKELAETRNQLEEAEMKLKMCAIASESHSASSS